MRFAIYIEAEHESGPRCGADAVAEGLCDFLTDVTVQCDQGGQVEWSCYTVTGTSTKRWER